MTIKNLTYVGWLLFGLPLLLGAAPAANSNSCSVLPTPTDPAFLGIQSQQISRQKARLLGFENPYGSYITAVIPGTAATKAGLRALDYLVGIDNIRVNENRDFSDLLQVFDAGQAATIHFIRLGKPMTAAVVFGHPNEREDPSFKSYLGVSDDDDDDEESERLGVRVEVVTGSSAEKMGLRDGDVVLSMNGYPIVDWSDLSALINSIPPDDSLQVVIERRGQQMTLKGTMGQKSGRMNFNISVNPPTPPTPPRFDWAESGRWREGSYGYLGIFSSEVSREKAQRLGFNNAYGSYITKVNPGTPAEKAGLQPFDYLFGIDDHRTSADQNLTAILRKYQPGAKVTIHLIRKGQEITLPLEMGDRQDEYTFRTDRDRDPFLGVQEGRNPAAEGIAVAVLPGASAAEMGLKSGDVITHINDYTLVDWSDLTTAIGLLEPGDTITVRYLRDGKPATAVGPIRSAEKTTWNWNWNWDLEQPAPPREGQRTPSRELDQSSRVRPENLRTQMVDPTATELERLRTDFGIDLPRSNTLTIDNLQLTPNTDLGLFRLQFALPQSGNTIVRLYNGVGRMIYEYELGPFSGAFSDDVDISQNGAGTYYLEVHQDQKSSVKKIVLLQ